MNMLTYENNKSMKTIMEQRVKDRGRRESGAGSLITREQSKENQNYSLNLWSPNPI